jgi:hypothetical protein
MRKRKNERDVNVSTSTVKRNDWLGEEKGFTLGSLSLSRTVAASEQ